MRLTTKDKSKQKVYDAIDYSFILQKNIRPTCWKGKTSQNSYSFGEEENVYHNKCDVLTQIFEIKDKAKFNEAYNDAVSGDGDEENRILTLHSSALCALLCFYSVSKTNPLTIAGMEFDEVKFEVKNEVVNPNNPSNVDVVLISNKNKTILFLESKFSEYLGHSRVTGINKNYAKWYNELNLTDLGFAIGEGKDGTLSLSKKDCYVGGIKQLISHWIGVGNFYKSGKSKDGKVVRKNYDVLLGEIVFNAWDKEDGSYKHYANEYKSLAKRLNEHSKSFKVLPELLTYQTVFKNYPLTPKVKQFYKL